MKLNRLALSVLLLGASLAGPVPAQIAEAPYDATGVSIPYPLIHLVHSRDGATPGTTADFSRRDPFLLYQLGRDLLNRQFNLSHGVYGRPGELSVPAYVNQAPGPQHGSYARIARDHTSSCGFCHSVPYREPGGGQTIGSTSAMGRSSTHFFGAGLVEMLGEQIHAQILERYDTNRNGVFDRAEVTGSRPVRIEPVPGARAIDFGDLSPGPDGVPRLSSLFRVLYVDAGRHGHRGCLRARRSESHRVQPRHRGLRLGAGMAPGRRPARLAGRGGADDPPVLRRRRGRPHGDAGPRSVARRPPQRPRRALSRRRAAVRAGRLRGPRRTAPPRPASRWTTPTETATSAS